MLEHPEWEGTTVDAHLGDSSLHVCFLTFRSYFADLGKFRPLGLNLGSPRPLLGHGRVVTILRV